MQPEDCAAFVRANSDHGGADVVLEVAGADTTFRLAWECARPNAIVTVVALYDKAQTLPPVSYTHLDVYKRQGWGNPSRPRGQNGWDFPESSYRIYKPSGFAVACLAGGNVYRL